MSKKIFIGLAILAVIIPLILSFSFSVRAIDIDIGGDDWSVGIDTGSGDSFDTSDLGSFGLPKGKIYNIIKNGLEWLLAIFGFIGILGFVISGIQYLLSAGNEETIKTAKRNMTWSIVGVLVGLMGVVIIQAIDRFLGAKNNF